MSEIDDNKTRIQARQEGLKLFFDVFKHLTTLSSGSIVLLAGFLTTTSKARGKTIIVISLACFLASCVGSFIVMLSTARTIRRNEKTDQLPDPLGDVWGYIIAVGGFAAGIGSLLLFAIVNL